MNDSVYRISLRISAAVLAVVLVFVSGVLFPVTEKLAYDTSVYMANVVGVGAAVEPTELNQLSAQISQRQRELDAREQALSEREIAVNVRDQGLGSSTAVFILSAILFILVVLIVLNFVLDYLRYREAFRYESTA